MANPATGPERGSKIWFNGKIVSSENAEEAKISLFTHALHYGTGVFEGIRAYKQAQAKDGATGAVFRLQEHMERFIESCKILGADVSYTHSELIQACIDTCKANQFDECYIRPIAFIGDGPLGVYLGPKPKFEIAILNWVWGKYVAVPTGHGGPRLKISSFVRPHVNSQMTRGKITGNYVNSVLAKKEAKDQGYSEALLLDPNGFLSEGSGENLFMVKNGVVTTTPLTSILNGITRRTVLEYLAHKKIPFKEALMTRDDLYTADEVFLTGTAAEISLVEEIDGRKIGPVSDLRKPERLAPTLQKDYDRIVRGDFAPTEFPFAKNFLTPIR